MTEKESHRYWAFISYSSKDRKWGEWLHRRLENYPIPADFRGLSLFDGATIGRHLRPVFRDRDELTGAASLGEKITEALRDSRFLIVLCSKNSAQSEWVNKEIEAFRAMGKGHRILALILDGEPNATSRGNPELECFPPALRLPEEPIAGDLRTEGDGKERGFLKVLAGVAELDFDKIYRRHERLRAKQRMIIGIAALTLIVVLTSLTAWALKERASALAGKEFSEQVYPYSIANAYVRNFLFDLLETLDRNGQANSVIIFLPSTEADLNPASRIQLAKDVAQRSGKELKEITIPRLTGGRPIGIYSAVLSGAAAAPGSGPSTYLDFGSTLAGITDVIRFTETAAKTTDFLERRSPNEQTNFYVNSFEASLQQILKSSKHGGAFKSKVIFVRDANQLALALDHP